MGIYPKGNLAYTSQILSTDDSSKIESSGQSTNSESTYSNLYTFDDVVMEEEVVSSEIIYGTKEQRNDITKDDETSRNDSLSQIIEDTIGDTTNLDNGIGCFHEEEVMYEDGNVQDNTSMAEAAMNNTCDQKIKIATIEQSTGINGH